MLVFSTISLDDSVVGQFFLELPDLCIGVAPLDLGRQTFHALDQNAAVPAPGEDRDASGAREVAPEPPQVMVRAFLVTGGQVDPELQNERAVGRHSPFERGNAVDGGASTTRS